MLFIRKDIDVMDKMIQKVVKYLAVISLLAVVITVLFSLHNRVLDRSFEEDFTEVSDIEKNALVSYADGHQQWVDLPASVVTNQPFSVVIDLSDYGQLTDKSLSLYLAYLNMSCLVDGKEIYRYQVTEDSFIKSGGYSLHIIDLPEDIKNKQIIFRYDPLFEHTSTYKLPVITLGKRLNIVLTNIFQKEAFRIFFVFTLFCLFGGTMIFVIFNPKDQFYDRKLLHIGLICLLFALYFGSKLWTVNYVFYSLHTPLYLTGYLALMLFPIPPLAMVRGQLAPRFDGWFNLAIAVNFINLLGQYMALLILGIEFREMLVYTHVVLAMSAIIIIISLIGTDGKEYKAKNGLWLAMMPLIFDIVVGLGAYRLYGRLAYVDLLIFGVFVFVAIQIYELIKSYRRLEMERVKNNIYRELALLDTMTGLGNRTAYNKQIEKIQEKEAPCWLVLMDLNNLKEMNDTYGHPTGDQMITGFAEALKQTIREHPGSQAFRVGGDEFIVLLSGQLSQDDENIIKAFVGTIRKKIKTEMLENQTMSIQFAVGYHYHRSGQRTIQETIYHADQKMYRDKLSYRQQGDKED